MASTAHVRKRARAQQTNFEIHGHHQLLYLLVEVVVVQIVSAKPDETVHKLAYTLFLVPLLFRMFKDMYSQRLGSVVLTL